jgi:hypothetical protein
MMTTARAHECGISLRPEHPEGIGVPSRDHGVVPGGAESAEERHVDLVERLAGSELPALANGMDGSHFPRGNPYSYEEDPSVTIHVLGIDLAKSLFLPLDPA